ncbi:MAG: proteasome accessory factor PafA2 family protein [bacterium]|nr:proteasome accessory factor PafA2 family protein [bacterium]
MAMKNGIFRERVYGIENEFAPLFVLSKKKVFGANYKDGNQVLLDCIRRGNGVFGVTSLAMGGNFEGGLWLRNGSRLYLDTGKHPEIASCECRRVRDAVAYNKATEMLATRILQFPKGDNRRIRIFKNNMGKGNDMMYANHELFRYETFGCHENYLLWNTPHLVESALYPLVPFLSTRQIYDGAGWWINPEKGEFVLSQRALFLSTSFSDSTTGPATAGRAIINLRNQPHGGEGSFKRFHLILGDANMLEYALFLKLATTGLALSLYENDELPKYFLEFPVKALHELARGRDFNADIFSLRSEGGRIQKMSALQLQSQYCELATEHTRTAVFESEESEHEARTGCNVWNEAITALARKDKEWPIGRIDYATKEYITEDMIRRGAKNLSPKVIRETVNLLYHELGDGTLYSRLKENGVAKRIVSEADIEHAIQFPPSDTRAHVRGTLICRALRKKMKKHLLNFVGWQEIGLGPPELREVLKKYPLTDPLESNPAWLNEVLLGCG